MTNLGWFTFAKKNEQKLCQLIHNFHPLYREEMHPEMHSSDKAYRDSIRANPRWKDPENAFKTALHALDLQTAYSILNETWFGVPHSREAFQIDGFNECCALIENGD